MRRRLWLLIAALAALALSGASPGAAPARTLTVDNGHTCSGAKYTTIQSAVDAANKGDRIRVCHGVYREFVHVTTVGVHLFTHGGATIESPARGPAPDTPIVWLDTAVPEFRGFAIRGDPAGVHCGTGLLITGRSHVERDLITDTDCNNQGPAGPYGVQISGFSRFEKNSVSDAGFAGVAISGGSYLARNFIGGNGGPGGNGVVFLGHGSAGVRANSVSGNAGTGIVVPGGRGLPAIDLLGNRVSGNGFGIAVGSPGSTRAMYVAGNGVFDNLNGGLENFGGPASFVSNRSLGNGGFDCFDALDQGSWKNNVGAT